MQLNDLTVQECLDAVAAKTPAPGGGAVAAIVSSLAAALAQMVVNYSIGKKSLAAHHDLHRHMLETLREFSNKALRLAEDDAIAYQRMNELWRLDRDDPVRVRDLPGAVQEAIKPPNQSLDLAVELLESLHRLCGRTNSLLNSDLGVAAVLSEAAARASAWNIRVNLSQLPDESQRIAIDRSINERLERALKLSHEIERNCRV